jgi:hypothetical protein
VRQGNGEKACCRWRTPRVAHQQSDYQDLRVGPPGLLGRLRDQCIVARRRSDDKRCRTMTNDQFTAILAERIMGWKACPDRFIKSGRTWIPRTRFRPLTRLEDAFLLLGRAATNYCLKSVDGLFIAEVQIGVRTGKESGEPKARTITLALARSLGLKV